MSSLLTGSLYNAVVMTLFIALICGLFGAVLGAVDHVRRKQGPVSGALVGGSLGLSIGLMIMGALGVAAGNVQHVAATTLGGLGSLVAGLLILALLRFFRPPQSRSDATLSGPGNRLSQLNKRPVVELVPSTAAAETPHHKNNIFISYRRDDSADITGRIYDRLVQHFGKDSIFKDVDSIPFGVDFRVHLQRVVEQCDAVLAIVGDQWLDVADETGKRRLDDLGDFVHVELEAALKRSIPVIPLLVKGARMPREDELPPDLKDFAYRNGTSVRHDPDFHGDMDRLIKSLEQALDHSSVISA